MDGECASPFAPVPVLFEAVAVLLLEGFPEPVLDVVAMLMSLAAVEAGPAAPLEGILSAEDDSSAFTSPVAAAAVAGSDGSDFTGFVVMVMLSQFTRR